MGIYLYDDTVPLDFSGLEGPAYERAYEHAYDFCPFGGNPGYSTARHKNLAEAIKVSGEFGYRLYKANPEGEPIPA